MELPDSETLRRVYANASQCLTQDDQIALSSAFDYLHFYREYLRDPPPCSGFALEMFLAANGGGGGGAIGDANSARKVAFIMDTFARERQFHRVGEVELVRMRETFRDLSSMLADPTGAGILFGPVATQINDVIDFAQRCADRLRVLAEENVRLNATVQEERDANAALAQELERMRTRAAEAENAAAAAGLL